jgi:hypothetical protein
MFDDNKSSDNASRLLAVIHLDADIRSSVIVGAANSSDNSSNLPERVATRSLFVRKRTPLVVFDLFSILVLVKMKAGHLSSFPQKMVRCIASSVGKSCDRAPRIRDSAPLPVERVTVGGKNGAVRMSLFQAESASLPVWSVTCDDSRQAGLKSKICGSQSQDLHVPVRYQSWCRPRLDVWARWGTGTGAVTRDNVNDRLIARRGRHRTTTKNLLGYRMAALTPSIEVVVVIALIVGVIMLLWRE